MARMSNVNRNHLDYAPFHMLCVVALCHLGCGSRCSFNRLESDCYSVSLWVNWLLVDPLLWRPISLRTERHVSGIAMMRANGGPVRNLDRIILWRWDKPIILAVGVGTHTCAIHTFYSFSTFSISIDCNLVTRARHSLIFLLQMKAGLVSCECEWAEICFVSPHIVPKLSSYWANWGVCVLYLALTLKYRLCTKI